MELGLQNLLHRRQALSLGRDIILPFSFVKVEENYFDEDKKNRIILRFYLKICILSLYN